MIALGDPIPLSCQLGSGATDKFVRATVYRADGTTQVSGSPVTLAHVSGGRYTNQALNMPSSSNIEARYQAFDDSGFLMPSDGESIVTERFYLDQSTGGGGTSNLGLAQVITGVVSSDEIVGEVEDCQ